MLRSSAQVRIGKKPEVLDALQDSKVMAVVWAGAWSEASLAFANRVVGKPEHNIVGSEQVLLSSLPKTSELRSNRHFNVDIERFTSVFERLGVKLLGRSTHLDLSRTEPAVGDDYINGAAPWHVDGGSLMMLSVPGGITTEFLKRTPKGTFDERSFFTPASVTAAESAAAILPQDAIIVFKGSHFPNQDKPHHQGLIHRRPNGKLNGLPQRGRLLVHFKA